MSCETTISVKDIKGVLIGCDKENLLKVQLQLNDGESLPDLYYCDYWEIESENGPYYFRGEVVERYRQNNACVVDVRVLGGIYKVTAEKQIDIQKEREAIIITSTSEKLIVSILKMNANRALIRSDLNLPEDSKVWLRYKDLAIASFANLEHNSDNSTFIYSLDFSMETLEKQRRIAEWILNDKL